MRVHSDMVTSSMVEASRGVKTNEVAESGSKSSTVESADTTTLSNFQDTAKLLESRLKNVNDVRKEKIDSLRASVANGTYRVSSDQIAAAMYRDMATSRQFSMV